LVADAKLQLSYARITAPISGRLGLRLVDQGNIVKASDTNGIAVITQIQPIAVVFTLPEDDLQAVMKQFSSGKGLKIEAYDRTAKVKLAEGQLLAIDNQIDTSTGTVKLKGQFANEDGALFANQFVNIKMLMDTLRSVTIIPTAAIQRGTIGAFVYVVKEDQTVSVWPLTLGPAEGAKVAVRNLRRDAIATLKEMLKNKECSEDDEHRAQDEIQKLTDRYVAEIEKQLSQKETELMAI